MAKQTKSASKSGSSRESSPRGNSSRNGSTTRENSGRQSDARQQSQMAQGEMEMHSSVEKLFVDQLKDIYYVEKNLVKALSKMAKKATTQELRDAFLEHQQVTQGQMERLEQVFEYMGKKPQAKRCPVMDGLLEESEEMMNETEDDTLTRDVALIVSGQKVEHYEIATYGCLVSLAKTYGMQEVADLLQETLDEEKEADESLTYIAENNVNYEAGQEDDEESEEEEE